MLYMSEIIGPFEPIIFEFENTNFVVDKYIYDNEVSDNISNGFLISPFFPKGECARTAARFGGLGVLIMGVGCVDYGGWVC